MALYEAGASDEEVIALLKVLPKDFERKLEQDKDFKKLVEAGRVKAKAWWLTLGRKAASTKGSADYNFWMANMDHRFGWKKTSAVTVEEREIDDPKKLISEFSSKLKRNVGRLNMAALGDNDDRSRDASGAG